MDLRALFRVIGERCFSPLALRRLMFTQIKNVMLEGVMFSQIPSMYKMESDKELFLPLCYSVYTLTKLSSYYAVQRLDAKSRVSIWASGYMQMILSCFLLAEQVFRKWWKFVKILAKLLSWNLVQIFESKNVKLNALFFLKKGLIIMK